MKANEIITLTGMQWFRVFAACQALTAPSRFYRVTHKRAKEVILESLGFCPKGKPGKDEGGPFRNASPDDYLDWLGAVHFEKHADMDTVLLVCKIPAGAKRAQKEVA